MSGISQESRNWRSGIEAVTALFAKYILSIVGGVVTIAGFVALVTASSARAFVKEHPYPVYLAFIIAVLINMATLNYVHALRKRNAQLTSVIDRQEPPRPSAHDVRFYAEVLSDIPVGGNVITWLKRTEMTELGATDFPADVLSALERTAERPRLRPVGFDDQETAAAFRALTGAIEDFRDAVEHWTLAEHSARWLNGAAESWATAEDRSAGTSALASRHAKLVQAYDAFIVTAHAHDIDAEPPSVPAGRSEESR